jgi:L-ascorbate metabolism protein UlaG (beta-lactamase superfamily)
VQLEGGRDMRIRHFLYNAFLIEDGKVKIAIDPGQNLWLFGLRSLIPKEEWKTVTHVLVTHGDPDHYWHADRVAIAGNAPLIVNKSMVRKVGGESHILAPRRGGLRFVPFVGKLRSVGIGESVVLDGVSLQTFETQHGPIEFSILGIRRMIVPGPSERAGFGSIGFKVQIGQYSIVNVGDSLLRKEWEGLNPDVAMLPIGGLGNNTWTMDVPDALEAVRLMSPKLVIPCHYNVPFVWVKKMAAADDRSFKREVEEMGIECRILKDGDLIEF